MEIKISVSQKLKILIYPGLHARPGSEFVKYCQQFDSDVEIKVGDKILFAKWGGTEITLDGQELLVMKESDILAVFEE